MGADVKAIRNRIRSVESTMHITKAMELVASSKLRHANEQMENSRFFFETLVASLSDFGDGIAESAFAPRKEVKRRALVVIAGDRGLAGGYNNNVFKTAASVVSDGLPYAVLPIGRRAGEHFKRRGIPCLLDKTPTLEGFTLEDCSKVGKLLADGYRRGEYDEVKLIFTDYITMLSQNPATLPLLPLDPPKGEADERHAETLYDPSAAAVLDAITPEYLSGMIWGAVCESFTSELAARRTAMDAASKNASEMIDTLSLRYNRARQSAITQEITEIIGGSEQQ
jgi:F-type H+-transporting ATPase subunit gamma